MSAAQLIEACGWKGHRREQVGVYEKHTLVFVHYGSGSAQQLQQLAKDVQASVAKHFGITLQPEVRIVGATL